VRAEVLPLLVELDPKIVHHLADIADELAAERAEADEPRSNSVTAASITLPRWAALLPRATQATLAALMRSRSPSARVWLPGDLVVSAKTGAPPPARARSTRRNPRGT
jgi:hypothetical protein